MGTAVGVAAVFFIVSGVSCLDHLKTVQLKRTRERGENPRRTGHCEGDPMPRFFATGGSLEGGGYGHDPEPGHLARIHDLRSRVGATALLFAPFPFR